MNLNISDHEFRRVQSFIFNAAGISLSPAKKALVCGRLAKRLRARSIENYADYMALVESGHEPQEKQIAVDLLTTNETYFFREPKHFDLLRQWATSTRSTGQPWRVWSAASSTGEEAYTIAMVLADCLEGRPFEVVGTDISTRVLARARTGHYPMERARQVPMSYLQRFCLRGQGEQQGTLLVDKQVRRHVRFEHANLNAELPKLGQFDVIFLRNVMIYFNGDTKRDVVARVVSLLKPGGYLCIGHSESLNEVNDTMQQVVPSVYRKP